MDRFKAYFTNSPWGNLYLDREFLSYGSLPLVFSLIDDSSKHYLAVCIDWQKDYEWLLIPVTANELIDFVSNAVTLFQLLTKDGVEKVYFIWPELSKTPDYKEYSQFPAALLPEKDVYLELSSDEYQDYLLQLKSELQIADEKYTIVGLGRLDFSFFKTEIGPIEFYLFSRPIRKLNKIGQHPLKEGRWFFTEKRYNSRFLRPSI